MLAGSGRTCARLYDGRHVCRRFRAHGFDAKSATDGSGTTAESVKISSADRARRHFARPADGADH
jgi:hypothetical protein